MIAQTMNHRSSPSGCRADCLGPIERARRIRGTKLRYINHASFDDPAARDAILGPLTHTVDDHLARRLHTFAWLALLPAGPSDAPVLSREQEAHMFRKMNYLKFRANQLKEQLDPDRPSPGDLDEIERLQSEALAVKNRIIEMNLGLVVSIARRRIRAGYDLSERVSDGNLALIQAVDGFDIARGNRFSTYATWAIRNVLAESERRFSRGRGRTFALHEESLAAPDAGAREHEHAEAQDQRRSVVRRWLGRLDRRERRILVSRYGIGGAPEQTLAEIGRQLGISKERVRQIAARAHDKLRKFARLEALAPLEI